MSVLKVVCTGTTAFINVTWLSWSSELMKSRNQTCTELPIIIDWVAAALF